MKDGTKPDTRGIAVHREEVVEVGHLKDRPRGEGALERQEGRLGFGVLSERVSPQETRQWRRDDAKVPDELPVVVDEA